MQVEHSFSVRIRTEGILPMHDVVGLRDRVAKALAEHPALELEPRSLAVPACAMSDLHVALFLDCVRGACALNGLSEELAGTIASYAFCTLRDADMVAVPAYGPRLVTGLPEDPKPKPALRLVAGTDTE
jgi:hypothetical protein